jgi:hypothetical protein
MLKNQINPKINKGQGSSTPAILKLWIFSVTVGVLSAREKPELLQN